MSYLAPGGAIEGMGLLGRVEGTMTRKSRYEASATQYGHYAQGAARRHEVEVVGVAPPNPLVGVQAGDRCPRPGCGGLVMFRGVVTLDGACDELVCSSCARSIATTFREPYRALAPARKSDR